jgi:hypothetical protein
MLLNHHVCIKQAIAFGFLEFLRLPPMLPTANESQSIASNPTAPATEEAIKQFFTEVYESWVKTIMSPFYNVNDVVKSVKFREKVAQAAKKYL